jgi:ankyrin repeat protein
MDFLELVRTGTPQDVQAAIRKGADVSARNEKGKTALMGAAEYNQQPGVITTLLAAGADAKAKDNLGKTAFRR